MIKQLSIKNFKSVRELNLSCRRVNVFIGEPNAGKTNILEALGLWCRPVFDQLGQTLRVNQPSDIYFSQNFNNEIEVSFDELQMFLRGSFDKLTFWWRETPASNIGKMATFDHELRLISYTSSLPEIVRYYIFTDSKSDASRGGSWLEPPFGNNLAALLHSNKPARQKSARFFDNSGYKLVVDVANMKVMVGREIDDALISFPYEACSETLRRMVFYHLAIDTSYEKTLVFDEPEAHAYPPYTKILAEKMAMDDRGNQFFLTTHSPYMLTSLIEKTPVDDLNVVLCRIENFETKAYALDEAQKVQLMEWGMSAFYNFDRLVDDES